MDDQQMQRMERRDGALFRKVGDVIAAEPERYDQSTWATLTSCGTVCCVAGHAVSLLTEVEFDFSLGMARTAHTPERTQFVDALAEEALGLTEGEATDLFDGHWIPAGDPATPLHERVREALYRLADGATVDEVTA